MSIPEHIQAFRIDQRDGHCADWQSMRTDQLSSGDVCIKVHYSSVNYKDALAATGSGKILRQFPLNGGIDVVGEVVASESDQFDVGEPVLATGSGLSETRDGGYSEYLNLHSDWTIPLPDSLSMLDAMRIGTAGFTAALSLYRMEANGQTPEQGPIVVTGASGGVGSLAVNILSQAGYEVHAISGKTQFFNWLRQLGAVSCSNRHDLYLGDRPLESTIWAGAIDTVGGNMLEGLTRVISPWGNIASCGLAGGAELHTTVMPFIIRGISLLGINSSQCPTELRKQLWQRLAGPWKPPQLAQIAVTQLRRDELPEYCEKMLAGQIHGRATIQIKG
ncbi:MAG: acryloyl-CoA reductase [Gammaproteobacteria bacterium]|jgi:acrylyl-CoA reductase (NADPH)|nr:acryloyl-CoA reductase [Gammaproteobacteria bacterium]